MIHLLPNNPAMSSLSNAILNILFQIIRWNVSIAINPKTVSTSPNPLSAHIDLGEIFKAHLRQNDCPEEDTTARDHLNDDITEPSEDDIPMPQNSLGDGFVLCHNDLSRHNCPGRRDESQNQRHRRVGASTLAPSLWSSTAPFTSVLDLSCRLQMRRFRNCWRCSSTGRHKCPWPLISIQHQLLTHPLPILYTI